MNNLVRARNLKRNYSDLAGVSVEDEEEVKLYKFVGNPALHTIYYHESMESLVGGLAFHYRKYWDVDQGKLLEPILIMCTSAGIARKMWKYLQNLAIELGGVEAGQRVHGLWADV